MKWLMMMPVMDDEPGAGGGGEPAPAPVVDNPGNDTPPAEPVKGAEGGDDEGVNPLLAKQEKTAEGEAQQNAEPIDDAVFAEAIKAEADAGYSFDAEQVKAMIPHLKTLGLTPEQSNTLANEYAKVQIAQQKAEIEARQARIAEWKPRMEQMVKENPRLAEEANAAIEFYCKNNPALEHVIRYTEVGSDPDFVLLLSDRGREILADRGAGRNAGKGGGNMTFSQAMA